MHVNHISFFYFSIWMSEDDSTQTLFVVFNNVGEHLWKDLNLLFHAEHFQVIEIFKVSLANCPLQLGSQIFNWDQVCSLRGPLWKILDFVVLKSILCRLWHVLLVIALLEGPTKTRFHDVNTSPWSPGDRITPNYQIAKMGGVVLYQDSVVWQYVYRHTDSRIDLHLFVFEVAQHYCFYVIQQLACTLNRKHQHPMWKE